VHYELLRRACGLERPRHLLRLSGRRNNLYQSQYLLHSVVPVVGVPSSLSHRQHKTSSPNPPTDSFRTSLPDWGSGFSSIRQSLEGYWYLHPNHGCAPVDPKSMTLVTLCVAGSKRMIGSGGSDGAQGSRTMKSRESTAQTS